MTKHDATIKALEIVTNINLENELDQMEHIQDEKEYKLILNQLEKIHYELVKKLKKLKDNA